MSATPNNGAAERLRAKADLLERYAKLYPTPVKAVAADKQFAADLRTLLAENERMREALTFYRDAWVSDCDQGYTHNDDIMWVTSTEPSDELMSDCGERARAALQPEEAE
jgi:hypothetical protein